MTNKYKYSFIDVPENDLKQDYLGHRLVKFMRFNYDKDYICEICGYAVLLYMNNITNCSYYYYIVNLTCEEYIIKTIIE